MKIPKKLLSNGTTNAKTNKNELTTFILYLSPWRDNILKINLCSHASQGCIDSCLNTAGRGAFNNVQTARRNKSNYFVSDRKAFVNQLANEIKKEVEKARKKNIKIAFRLNGTSDIDFIYLLKKYANFDICSVSDTATFYDYTKVKQRALRYIDHKNYVVTFSRSETNEKDALEVLSNGGIVSAVFRDNLPESWHGFHVIDGDTSDLVMIKPGLKYAVLGLKAKGKAKKDTSGFVIY